MNPVDRTQTSCVNGRSAACRRASEYERIMRAGWRKPFGMPDMLGKRVNGQTLGIVGLGRIGRAVGLFARGGLAALEALEDAGWDIFTGRPRPSRLRLAREALRR